MRFRSLPLAAAGLALAACQPAKTPTPAPTPAARPAAQNGTPTPGQPTPGQPTPGQPTPGQPPAGGLAGLGGGGADPAPRPYATVITPRAKTKTGVFGVHQVGSRLYFELPKSEIGKDFVVTTVLAGTPAGIGINGTGFMGKAHAFAYRAALAAFPDIPVPRLEMIADVNEALASRAAHQYGFARSSAEWRTLVNDPRIGVVSITTPNTLHKQMALAAIAIAIAAISKIGAGQELRLAKGAGPAPLHRFTRHPAFAHHLHGGIKFTGEQIAATAIKGASV